MDDTLFTVAVVHTSPVFMDRNKTVEKACRLIGEAAENGARRSFSRSVRARIPRLDMERFRRRDGAASASLCPDAFELTVRRSATPIVRMREEPAEPEECDAAEREGREA